MKGGLRPVDEALVARILSQDRRRAAQLEAAGHPLQALRRLQHAASTYDGLAAVEDIQRDVARLEAEPSTRRRREEERRWDRYEEAMLRRHQGAYRELVRADPPPALALLRALLSLDELQEHADAGGYEGVVGRRLLEALAAQAGFYMMRDFLNSSSLVRASLSLEIATELRPGRSDYWYNLACVRARLGSHEPALDALERAVTVGFSDQGHMASDEDLRSLRDDPRFRVLLGESGERDP